MPSPVVTTVIVMVCVCHRSSGWQGRPQHAHEGNHRPPQHVQELQAGAQPQGQADQGGALPELELVGHAGARRAQPQVVRQHARHHPERPPEVPGGDGQGQERSVQDGPAAHQLAHQDSQRESQSSHTNSHKIAPITLFKTFENYSLFFTRTSECICSSSSRSRPPSDPRRIANDHS